MTTSETVPFVDLGAQYNSIKKEIDAAMAAVIADAAFIGGRFVRTFEEEFAAFLGIEHCIGCANGTDSLEILLKALDIGAGDEVIVPANSWISTSEAVTTAGATPVFVDCHPAFYTIDTAKIEEKITPRTKAIIPVHLYGLPAEMDQVMAIAARYQLRVIEDCAQAHGATYNGKLIGTIGDAGSFSFYPGKNLGAYGDAGCMVTSDSELAIKVRMIANHGRLDKFGHAIEGRNSRLDGLQAAILSAKLPHLHRWTELRRNHAALYSHLLSESGLQLPESPEYSKHVFHLYVIQVPERERIRQELAGKGIETGIHYPIPLPFLKAYSRLGHQPADFPVAFAAMGRILSIPMFADLSERQLTIVAGAVLQCIGSTVDEA